MTRKSASIVIVILIFAALPVVHVLQQQNDSNAFDAIEPGASKEDVVAALGQPDEIRACPDTLFWGGNHRVLGPNNGQCVEEFYYSSAPGGWSIGFDAEGHAVSKFAYVSP